jgi:integrase
MSEEWKTYKRTIKKNGLGWPGWDTIGYLLAYAPSDEHRNAMTVLLLTGCRISEALLLKPTDFDFSDSRWIKVNNIAVLKHWKYAKENGERIPNDDLKKNSEWKTEKTSISRSFRIIRKGNFLTFKLEKIIDQAQANGWGYVFPKKEIFGSSIDPHNSMSRTALYKLIRDVDTHKIINVTLKDKDDNEFGTCSGIWPHLLRSWCASYLVDVLGCDAYKVRKFFEWSSLEMSVQYVVDSDVAWEKIIPKDIQAEENVKKSR